MRMPSKKTSAKLLDCAVLVVGVEPNRWYGSHPHTTLVQVLQRVSLRYLSSGIMNLDNINQEHCSCTNALLSTTVFMLNLNYNKEPFMV